MDTIIRLTKQGPEVIVPAIDYIRHCVRCGEGYHGTAQDQPHLCADVAERFEAFLAEEREVAFREHQPMLVVYGGEG